MESEAFSLPVPYVHYADHMSYMMSPALMSSENGIYFGGDNRIVRTPSDKIPVERGDVPAWLISDWLMAIHRGEPISIKAAHIVKESINKSPGLNWVYTQFCQ